jgi:transcription-repair coupling factor (superfamily II helicase)
MRLLSTILDGLRPYRALARAMEHNQYPQLVTGLQDIHKAHWGYALSERFDRRLVYIASDENEASRAVADLSALYGDQVILYPYRDMVYRSVANVSREWAALRISALARVERGDFCAVVTLPEAVMEYTLSPARLREHSVTVATGDEFDLEEMARRLVAAGYRRSSWVEGPGQFAIRGGILDVFSPGEEAPVRIELFGDQVDAMGFFDPHTQRRTENLEKVSLTPALEVLYNDAQRDALLLAIEDLAVKYRNKNPLLSQHLYEDLERIAQERYFASNDKYIPLLDKTPATFFDYIGQDTIILASEKRKTDSRLESFFLRWGDDLAALMEAGILCRELSRYSMDPAEYRRALAARQTVFADNFETASYEGIPLRGRISVQAKVLAGFAGKTELLLEELQDYKARNMGVLIFTENDKRAQNLRDVLYLNHIVAPVNRAPKEVPEPGAVVISPMRLSAGFEYAGLPTAVLCEAQLSASVLRVHRPRKAKSAERVRTFSDLSVGDLVVHYSHGIGRYMGMQQLAVQGVTKDYIKIQYQGTDMLYVPYNQLDLLSKYTGGREGHVKLSKMSGGEWQRQKARVRAAAQDMAKELIELYAARSKIPGHAFPEDSEWQREFEDRFEYDETEDQLRSIAEMKGDMQKAVPMDRLLCGDVGFGKTEVALRGAFKAILDSKQVAFLVPTTVLAWQHYQTIARRMENFPVRVEMLSRFRTATQQRDILRRLQRGEVDIVVGTHRLLQKDVSFRDLGLVIVDEEQRFGVVHKEKLKAMTEKVDVLTLTATPIPRTLYMALSGMRDMSTLDNPPSDRYPVQTYVLEHDRGVLADAILREIRRGGQVFYLHNRVESIVSKAAGIAKLCEGARVGIAHGKMDENQLSDAWQDMVDGKIDVMVCTTIIETGIDIPNANTLIVEDADRLGLAQLHQIRGRIGRSNRRAFAYFTYRRGKVLSDLSAKRLSAIRQYTEFGSGFKIAMRDLEIRGAGNVLGSQQSGHMESVGYDVYLRLLEEAVAELRGDAVQSRVDCTVDIFIDALIPREYIESEELRVDIYQKIASMQTQEDREDLLDELADRFGDIPVQVLNLMDIALLRNRAGSLRLSEISEKNEEIWFYPEDFDLQIIGPLYQALEGRLVFTSDKRPSVRYRKARGESTLKAIGRVLDALEATAVQLQSAGQERNIN